MVRKRGMPNESSQLGARLASSRNTRAVGGCAPDALARLSALADLFSGLQACPTELAEKGRRVKPPDAAYRAMPSDPFLSPLVQLEARGALRQASLATEKPVHDSHVFRFGR
jgi:hypothetical protein